MRRYITIVLTLQIILFSQIVNVSSAADNAYNYKVINEKLNYNSTDFQWYKNFYKEINSNEKSPIRDVKIALFGEEIAPIEEIVQNYQEVYDPFTKKIQKNSLAFYDTNITTKFAGIITDNFTHKLTANRENSLSLFSVPIYKKDNKLTSSVIINGLNWALTKKINIIYIENSLMISQINEPNTEICKKISTLRENNIFTVTLSGNQYPDIPAILEIEKCSDIITISPLDKKFELYPGFTNTVNPSFSLPAVDFPVYTNFGSVVSHGIFSDPQFAAALFIYILTDKLSNNFINPGIILNNLAANAYDLPKSISYKDNFLYTKDNFDFNSINNEILYMPKINSIVSDGKSSFYITWESNSLFALDKFIIDIYALNDNSVDLIKTLNIDNNEVRALVDFPLSNKNFVVLRAKRYDNSYSSLPNANYTIESYEQKNNPYGEIVELKAKWSENGVIINVILNEIGKGSNVNIAILDGWTNQPLKVDSILDEKDYLWRVPQSDLIRENPHYILAILNNKTFSIPLYPEFPLTAKVLSAGKKNIAVTGETTFACNSLPVKVGCSGSTIQIFDKKTNKVLAEAKVNKDLTFTSTFSYNKKTVSIYVAIKGGKNEYRSNFITRSFANR
jgi:hypothetical protein